MKHLIYAGFVAILILYIMPVAAISFCQWENFFIVGVSEWDSVSRVLILVWWFFVVLFFATEV